MRLSAHIGRFAVLALATACVVTTQAAAARPAGVDTTRVPFPPGEVTEHVVSEADASQSYAVYLPTSYSADRYWPVLLLMDPRGRAMVPLELFKAPAERLGYVILSSYNTQSDGPTKPNEDALNAMIADADSMLAIDARRLYIAGFSGTAHLAWVYGFQLHPHLAGILGFGGGWPGELDYPEAFADVTPSFVFFGGAGTFDFNHEEMEETDLFLDEHPIPHRIEYYDGPHGWPPADVAARGLGFMEVQAMWRGLRPVDIPLADSILARRMDDARALEAQGDAYDAYHAYQGIVEDFRGLTDVDEALQRANALENDDQVQATAAEVERLREEYKAFVERYQNVLNAFTATTDVPEVDAYVAQLGLKALQERAAQTDDPRDAQAAQRIIELIYVQQSFYEPRRYLEAGQPLRALYSLQVAQMIRPDSPRVCWFSARAFALAGQMDAAFGMLECVLDSGFGPVFSIDTDTYLDPLRGDPRFADVMRRWNEQRRERAN